MESLESLFRAHKVCAILRGVPMETVMDYAGAAYDGGVRLFEVALNSPRALEQIAALGAAFGEEAYVGAGTVTTPELARQAAAAGARFLLSPSASPEVLDWCARAGLPILPGVMTPTDVDLCMRHGWSTLKLFPAGDLPAFYLRSLLGPFDSARFVAVGGINLENAGDFLARGFIGVGIGGGLIPRELAAAGAWARAAERIHGMMTRL